MSKNIKVSVIVPVYNVEKYLSRCIESIINQTIKDIEIILVDDGSPDQSPQICDEYALKDGRIRVIHKKNGGLASARNAGMKIARGDYIFFVDSDDWLELDGLQLLYDKAIEYNVDFVRYRAIRTGWPGLEYNAPCMLETPREIEGGYYNHERMIKEIFPKLIATPQLTMGPIVGAWGSLYSRQFLIDNHLFFYEKVKFSEDLIFSANVVKKSKSFYYIDTACVYHYFYNHTSISKSFRKDRWESCQYLIQLFEKDFSNDSDYDFTLQLNYLRWFCIFLALGERKYLKENKRKEYCKSILFSKDVNDTKYIRGIYDVSVKQKIMMLMIKCKFYRIFIKR